ncbi:MAG: hypothetical protein ACI9OE_002232 [Mariniflexile sp.]|jgi:hypothetical protein
MLFTKITIFITNKLKTINIRAETVGGNLKKQNAKEIYILIPFFNN